MITKKLLYKIILTLTVVGCVGCSLLYTNKDNVIWHVDKDFEVKASELKISPQAAYIFLKKKIDLKTYKKLSSHPSLIFDNKYYFTKYSKFVIPQEGYFVDGNTGKVYSVETKKRLKGKPRKVDKDMFIYKEI